jgi:hypothetical protein
MLFRLAQIRGHAVQFRNHRAAAWIFSLQRLSYFDRFPFASVCVQLFT